MFVAIQLLLGWLYGHLAEYIIHRWFLHNHKLFKRAFKHHYSQHHAKSKRGIMLDLTYVSPWNIFEFEIQALFFGIIIHLPLVFLIPYFYLMVCYSAAAYYLVHRRSHQDFKWARTHIPWHYDHHMGPDPNKNWGVRSDIFDRIFGTKEVYKGTTKEIIRYRNYEYRGAYELRPRRNKRREH